MIDVMHADLMERGLKITDLSINNTLVENLKVGSRPKSIISSYLSDINGNSTAARRVIKSIFADGSTESLRIFPEVFPNETKMRKSHDGQELRKQHLNSYYTKNLPEDDLDETDLIDCDSILNFRKDEDCSEEYWMGGIEAVTLRQRLITLVSLPSKRTLTHPHNVSTILIGKYDSFQMLQGYIKTILLCAKICMRLCMIISIHYLSLFSHVL